MNSCSTEFQILNKILDNKSLEIILSNGIDESFFIEYKNEFNYIIQHDNKYHNVPDKLTFLDKFADFDFIEVTETDDYLVNSLAEQKMYRESVPILQKAADMLQTNSNDAVNYLTNSIEELQLQCGVGKKKAVNIISKSDERLQEYKKRKELKGMLGIQTGIPELDDVTAGMMPEDLIILFARTNQGKSWLNLYMLINAWKQGKKVLMYSGEMSRKIMGFRFDTLLSGISNTGLSKGNEILINRQGQELDYANYLDDLKNNEVPFYIITPQDLSGDDLDVRTLENMIRIYKPDIVGIDQLSLMRDRKKGKDRKTELANITKDLRKLAEVYQLPIIALTQASREAENDKKKDTGNVPSLTQIADSDDIARNSTRVISFTQIEDILKLKLIKNTFGKVGQECLMKFDWNYGVFIPWADTITSDDNIPLAF